VLVGLVGSAGLKNAWEYLVSSSPTSSDGMKKAIMAARRPHSASSICPSARTYSGSSRDERRIASASEIWGIESDRTESAGVI